MSSRISVTSSGSSSRVRVNSFAETPQYPPYESIGSYRRIVATAPFVRAGQLEVLLEDYALPSADIYAVYPNKENLAAKVRVFVDFLAEHFAQKSGQQRSPW